MLAAGKPATYVDPFDRICHGLRTREEARTPRNYRLERSTFKCSRNRHNAQAAAPVLNRPQTKTTPSGTHS